MTTEIANQNGALIRTHQAGYAIEKPTDRTKFSGKLANALSSMDWVSARERLTQIREELYAQTKAMGPLSLTYNGIAGAQTAEDIIKSQCVELILNYFTVSHLATSETASTKSFPGNHGQALTLMIERDIEDHALKNGPFTSEAELLQFIESRMVAVSESIESAVKIKGVCVEIDEDEDDEELEEGIAA